MKITTNRLTDPTRIPTCQMPPPHRVSTEKKNTETLINTEDTKHGGQQEPEPESEPEPTKPHYHHCPNPPETSAQYSGQKPHYPNPPEISPPDPITLRDQWRYATRQYARWYSQAWGTAILAGAAFFALGWIIKGSNPLPSRQDHHYDKNNPNPSSEANQEQDEERV